MLTSKNVFMKKQQYIRENSQYGLLMDMLVLD